MQKVCTLATSTTGRLDKTAAAAFAEYSRNQLQAWIRAGRLLVDGLTQPLDYKLRGGERLELEVPPETLSVWQPEAVPLTLVYEDEQIAVINKPAGLVMHPAAGNEQGTVANGLLHRYPELRHVPRAGIVHRLDKDTTGLLVVAKNAPAQKALMQALQARQVERTYLVLLWGNWHEPETITAAIGRHPVHRKKMAVVTGGGKPATTHLRPLRHCAGCTLAEARLDTGRTHQIRVHVAWRGYPVVGDPVYGGKSGKTQSKNAAGSPAQQQQLAEFKRQALHARTLVLPHPVTGQRLCFTAELPLDFFALFDSLWPRSTLT